MTAGNSVRFFRLEIAIAGRPMRPRGRDFDLLVTDADPGIGPVQQAIHAVHQLKRLRPEASLRLTDGHGRVVWNCRTEASPQPGPR